ncbi:MAG: Hsp20/alpha crystallin family protein, partial [Candidatus Thiodiazotropha sp.]
LFGVVFLACLSIPIYAQPPAYPISPAPYYRQPMEREGGFNIQRSVRFKQNQDENGYHLYIQTRGYEPKSIQVKVEAPFLVVENQESQRLESRHEHGYSFTASSSSMRRRFMIPGDADLSAMQRSERDGVIDITLPYRR